MWISTLIGVSVMYAMNAYPVDGTVLEGKCSARCNEVLQPLWSGVSAVSQQAVVAHRDPDILRQHPHHQEHDERRPPKKEHCGQRGKVKNGKGYCKYPVGPASHRLGVKRCLVVKNQDRGFRELRMRRRLNLHDDDPLYTFDCIA
jgi:hypothetical protein